MLKNELDAALVNFSRAVELNPRLASGYHGRGTVLMKLGDLSGAIADFTRALQINADLPHSYLNRGLALLLLGKESEAKSDFEKCLILKPALAEDLQRRIDLAKKMVAPK
jgi:tetratricopeptide (TPR) repeat protein